MEGCEAVIHLGAIPSPYSFPDEVVFNNNVRNTFAVFQAARLLGVKKVPSPAAFQPAAPDPTLPPALSLLMRTTRSSTTIAMGCRKRSMSVPRRCSTV